MKKPLTKQGVQDLNSLPSRRKVQLPAPPPGVFGEEQMSDEEFLAREIERFRRGN